MSDSARIEGHFPTAEPDERAWYLARIEPESSRLMQNEVSQAQMVITLLSGANAGGAVATLAYIAQFASAAGPAKLIPHSSLVLSLFVIGFVASMLLAICVYYSSAHRLWKWGNTAGSFYKGEVLWRGLWDSRKDHRFASALPHVLGWTAMGLFSVGVAIGIAEMVCGGGFH